MTSLRAALPLHSRGGAPVKCTRGVIAHRIPPAPLHVWRPATLTAWSRAGVSTALAILPLARKEITIHVCAANVACGHAHVAAATIPCSALKSFAMAVVALHVGSVMPWHSRERALLECTLGVVAHWIPATPLYVRRPAALTAWSSAGVSTALAAFALAREVVALHVCAAD